MIPRTLILVYLVYGRELTKSIRHSENHHIGMPICPAHKYFL